MATTGRRNETNRPVAPAPTAVDPRREAFWSAAYCALLTGNATYDGIVGRTRIAAEAADAALAEHDKRWGAKEQGR